MANKTLLALLGVYTGIGILTSITMYIGQYNTINNLYKNLYLFMDKNIYKNMESEILLKSIKNKHTNVKYDIESEQSCNNFKTYFMIGLIWPIIHIAKIYEYSVIVK